MTLSRGGESNKEIGYQGPNSELLVFLEIVDLEEKKLRSARAKNKDEELG